MIWELDGCQNPVLRFVEIAFDELDQKICKTKWEGDGIRQNPAKIQPES